MNWHHGIDSATIEEMKINWYSHRVLKIKEPIMANLFEHIPLEDLVYLKRVYGTDNLVWETPIGPPNEANLEIYRLREDWERPKRKAVVEDARMEFRNGRFLSTKSLDKIFMEINGWSAGKYRITVEEL